MEGMWGGRAPMIQSGHSVEIALEGGDTGPRLHGGLARERADEGND